ncbi:hypothetical protein DY138_01455 [Apilactobacillus timberlakei]|uniref:hypothetical protein n=1 Tax=Apilactobacillus timberlakei TaxID=2008380 RepID=UPI00112A6AB4|nr:hypothetical protein [Apilactobacillus timberlakei]TPR20134.1 hypothetical protein DY138_01455 [Apilactobacillus timberlakei]TPR20447.1 hypothetical protein DY083_08280 [Apilactobacillus timberlakei]TPR21852.1 hypothetical protein DY061_01370 [Apilactobacillus timberlakei]
MEEVKISEFSFQYDKEEMNCFADQQNNRIAFIQGSEIQLIIDIVNDKLTFHPDNSVNIYEISNDVYRIESLF